MARLAAAPALLVGCAAFQLAAPPGPIGRQSRITAAVAGTAMENLCQLTVRRGALLGLVGSTYNSSAVLYQGRFLLTAAHNVYGGSLRSIDVRCGTADASSGPVTAHILPDATAYAASYRGHGDYRHDLGMIRLPAPVTLSAGVPPVVLADTLPVTGTNVRLSGYPGQRINDPERLANAKRLFSGTGVVLDEARPGLIAYFIHTTTGNSGGPVWVERPDNSLQLVGIHVVGYFSRGAGARQVDDWFRSEVDRMIRALDERAARRQPI